MKFWSLKNLWFLGSGNTWHFLQLRKNTPSCNPSGGSTTEDTIKIISDVDGVLVSQVGRGAGDKLIAHGIQPVIIPMLIDDALKHLYLGHQKP